MKIWWCVKQVMPTHVWNFFWMKKTKQWWPAHYFNRQYTIFRYETFIRNKLMKMLRSFYTTVKVVYFILTDWDTPWHFLLLNWRRLTISSWPCTFLFCFVSFPLHSMHSYELFLLSTYAYTHVIVFTQLCFIICFNACECVCVKDITGFRLDKKQISTDIVKVVYKLIEKQSVKSLYTINVYLVFFSRLLKNYSSLSKSQLFIASNWRIFFSLFLLYILCSS